MPARPRFQLQGIVHRGYPIAHIRDTKAGRDCWVYFKLGRLCHWDRMDDPVENESLRRMARRALKAEETGEQVVAPGSGEQMSLAGVRE